jgi:hypothetical protein
MSGDLAGAQEEWPERQPALRAMFAAFSLKDGLEETQSVFWTTRNQAKRGVDASIAENPMIEAGGGY